MKEQNEGRVTLAFSSSQMNSEQSLSPFEAYHKYIQLYTTAYHLNQQTKTIRERQTELTNRIKHIQTSALTIHPDQLKVQQIQQVSPQANSKSKRKRRLATQINKEYICTEQRCQRQYGTLGSLQQHIRIKHPQMYLVMRMTGNYQNELHGSHENPQSEPSGSQ